MKLISWNVNGLRACMTKGFMDFFNEADADIFCLQETKLSGGAESKMKLPGYESVSGIMRRKRAIPGRRFLQSRNLCRSHTASELRSMITRGRVITLEYPDYYVVTVYTPNSQDGLARLDYRMKWEDDFLRVFEEAGREQAGDFLRRSECGAQGD